MFSDNQFAGSWPDLLARLDAAGTVRGWAAADPALTGLTRVDDITGVLVKGADRHRADQVMGALVRLAARDGGDDADAVLLLLHLLSDGVLALGRRMPGPADVTALIVAELTCQIRSFPWRRRTRAYAANLLLDTKHVLWRESAQHRAGNPEELTAPHCLDGHDRQIRGPGAVTGAAVDDDDLDLIDVLMWAARTGVAPPTDLVMLLLSERAPAGPHRHAVAWEFGVHERALRRRRSRTLAVLRAASDRYLQAA
jgi:hypothetical protein